jgi:predicted metal-binding membrane protein
MDSGLAAARRPGMTGINNLSMAPASSATALSPRDRLAVGALLVGVTALAWAYTAHRAYVMQEMDAAMLRDMAMPMNDMEAAWSPVDAALIFLMWTVMMAAMMVPAAAPMTAAFAAINRRRRERAAPYVPTAIFLCGYLLAWSGFALAATALQWALQRAGFLTTMMQSASAALSAALFVLAGLYQFSPLKDVCLAYCRSPQAFVLTEWRDGAAGAVIMGLRHGLFCTGCCAALMVLLFAVAVMDLRWVAALTVLVTAEKLLPGARYLRIGIGVVLIAVGVMLAFVAWRAG